jgi:hypothetical protein
MDDFSLDALRARERSLEEEWISKYRAALLAFPNHETWEDRLHKIAYKVYGDIAESAQQVTAKILSNKVVARCIQFASRSSRTIPSQPHFSMARTVHASTPRKSHAVGVTAQGTKKAG